MHIPELLRPLSLDFMTATPPGQSASSSLPLLLLLLPLPLLLPFMLLQLTVMRFK